MADGVRLEPPALEMLWEPTDPREALRARFGFDGAAAVADWVATTLVERWGVRVTACVRVVLSAHNALAWVEAGSGPMVAKWSVVPELFPRLQDLARLTAGLAERGLPVSAPVAALDGRLQVEVDGVSLGVQRRIEGALLDPADGGQVHAVGAVLARLHGELAEWPAGELSTLPVPTPSLPDRVGAWLDRYPAHLPASGREVLSRLVAAAGPDLLPTQPVHGDIRSANVLWSGSRVAAVLDFEEARIDQPVVELARSAVLLGTRFHAWGPVSADVRATLLAGYRSVRYLTPAELSWWDLLVLWDSLAMVPVGDDPTGWGAAAHEQLDRLARST